MTSVTIGWLDAEDRRQFYAHAFVRRDGSIAASGLLDPKVVRAATGRYYRATVAEGGST